MRYQARWSNGCWKTFDRVRFADVETHATQKIAEEAAEASNRKCVRQVSLPISKRTR